MAEPQVQELPELSPEHKQAVLNAYQTPDDPTSKQVIEVYESNSKPKYTNDNAVIPAKFQPIDPDLLDQAKPQSTLSKVGEGAAKIGAGAAMGVAELANPLAIPHGVESLARGAYKYATSKKGLLDSLKEGSDESITAPMTLKQLAPIGRSLVRAPFSDQKLPDIYDQEVAAQNKFQDDPLVQGAQTTTEVGGAVLSLAQLAKQVKNLPKVEQAFVKLKGLRAMNDPVGQAALTSQQVQEAGRLQSQLLGDLAPELKTALHDNTSTVRSLFEGPADGRSTMSTVNTVRDSLKKNQELLGSTIGEFRSAMTQKNPQQFDTSLLTKSLSDFQKDRRLSGGISALKDGETRTIEGFQSLLQNSGKKGSDYTFDTRDATIMIDTFDDYLKAQGYYDGKQSAMTLTNKKIHELRDGMDQDLAAMYPVYKEVKLRYSDFLNDYNQIQKRIEGLGAEGFVNNLFGRNKSEVRQLFESTLNKGQETADAFQKAVGDASNLSATNKNYNQVVASMAQKAKDIKFQRGQDVMNEIANKAMARRLAEVSDKDADVVRNLIQQHIAGEVSKADKQVQKAGAIAQAVPGTIGAAIGLKSGDALTGTLVGGAIGYSSKGVVQSIVKAKQGDVVQKAARAAEQTYSIDNLLKSIEQSKTAAQDTKDLAKATRFIQTKFGDDSAKTFLENARATKVSVKDIQNALRLNAVTKGLIGVTESTGDQPKRNFADDIQRGR